MRILQKFFLEAEEDSESGGCANPPKAEGAAKAEVQSEDERQTGDKKDRSLFRDTRRDTYRGVALDESGRNRNIYHSRAS